MPTSVTVADEKLITPPAPKTIPPPYQSWCEWAQDNLRKAMEGLTSATGGVSGYGIGSRWVRYGSAGDQAKAVDYWMRLVEFYCGTEPLPPGISGRECAFRAIPRDV